MKNKNFDKEKKVQQFLNIIDKHKSAFIELDGFFVFSLKDSYQINKKMGRHFFNNKQEKNLYNYFKKNISWIWIWIFPSLFWEYEWTFQNKYMSSVERSAISHRLFFKYQNQSDFEYYFDIFNNMKDIFIDDEIKFWKKK